MEVPELPSSRGAREKRRKRRTQEPFFQQMQQMQPDPDRPANIAPPPAEFVGGGSDNKDMFSNMLTAVDTDDSYFPHPPEENTSDSVYKLEPDWTKQFDGPALPPWIKDRIAAKQAEVPLETPWGAMDGGPTLWQKVPAPIVSPLMASIKAAQPGAAPAPIDDARLTKLEQTIESKLERMFAKLEEIDKTRKESNHIEIILFVLGGLFLLLMLDMLVKQGTKATMLVAVAGGGSLETLYKRYMLR